MYLFWFLQLSKFDLKEKRVLTYNVEENLTPGEPVFLARPGATKEDDGQYEMLLKVSSNK